MDSVPTLSAVRVFGEDPPSETGFPPPSVQVAEVVTSPVASVQLTASL